MPLARATLRRLRLLVSPDTVLRWHRDLIKRRPCPLECEPDARTSAYGRFDPPSRLTPGNREPSWGYRRIHGELALLGVAIAASTVWEILKTAGIDPAPRQTTVTWAEFLRSQAEAILAMDFIETITLTGQRQYILSVIHHASRRAWTVGTTAHPTHAWVTQAIRNLLMDLEDTGYAARIRFLIRDRDAKYPALIDDVIGSAGIETVLTGVRMPRMNSIMERWVKTLRAELLDRTLIWNQTHLRHALREYERHYNGHRTRRSLAAATPLRARPQPLETAQIERLTIDRHDRLGGVIHEYRFAA